MGSLLTKKIFLTIFIVWIYRVGKYIPILGVDPKLLSELILTKSSVVKNLKIISGHDEFLLHIFTLNIFPYINASILIQFFLPFSPELKQLQKEEGEAGRKEIQKLTKYLSLFWAFVQSVIIALTLKPVLFDWNLFILAQIVLSLVCGFLVLVWLSDLITDYGLGNGSSLFLVMNIISQPSLMNLFQTKILTKDLIFAGLLILILVFGIIFVQNTERSIPLLSPKQLKQMQDDLNTRKTRLNQKKSENRLPIGIAQAGILPIIFASYTISLLTNVLNFDKFTSYSSFFLLATQFVYILTYLALVTIFSYFYSVIILNPKDIYEELSKASTIIKGINPGSDTLNYLKLTIARTIMIGGIFLGVIVLLPGIFYKIFDEASLKNINAATLILIVGVTSDLIKELRNLSISESYKV
uniref:SecY-type transporter protein n=1 Tax=Olisthodiscus luteus TaxID=83000 RepID=A0A7U0KT56_OLILU|nr:SecY-type transporter protein [Olisthodiscus luteus]QQW50579.1 SecY-type transporter protein [Olisthodiscus luteus]